MTLSDVVWLFILASVGYVLAEWVVPDYGICGVVIGAVIAILFGSHFAYAAARLFERLRRCRAQRIVTFYGLLGVFGVLVLFVSCVWALTPRSWSTREKPAQMLARLESTYQLQFPTNMQIANSKAWWESFPRTSDARYTALQVRCDSGSWAVLRNTFGTNFYGGTYIEPHGRNLQRHVPWMTTVKPNWNRYSGRFQTRDAKDNWLRIHWCDIYFAPPMGTNQDVVVLAWDTRSERNW